MANRLTVTKTLLIALASFLLLGGATRAQVYNQFSPGGDLTGSGSTWNMQFLGNGVVSLTKLANLPADTVNCNPSNSSAIPAACNPLAVANLITAPLVVNYVATVNITLSGSQTVDGVTVPNGSTVLATAETSSVNNGIYTVNTGGAWTLAVTFPSGYVIAAGCPCMVHVLSGVALAGSDWILTTTSAVTIGTSAQVWTAENNIASYSSLDTTNNIVTLGVLNPGSGNLTLKPVTPTSTPVNIAFQASQGNATVSTGGSVFGQGGNGFEGAGGTISFSAGAPITQGSTSYAGSNVQISASNTNLTSSGGTVSLIAGTGTPNGSITANGAILSAGTKPTLVGTGGCATPGAPGGGASAFQFTCTGTPGASTITITYSIHGAPGTHGAYCSGVDQNSGTFWGQTAQTHASASITSTLTGVTAGSGDIVVAGCTLY